MVLPSTTSGYNDRILARDSGTLFKMKSKEGDIN